MNRLIAAAFIAVLTTPALGQTDLLAEMEKNRQVHVALCVLRFIDRAHTDLAVKFILASCQEWPRELDPRPERDNSELSADELKELEQLQPELERLRKKFRALLNK